MNNGKKKNIENNQPMNQNHAQGLCMNGFEKQKMVMLAQITLFNVGFHMGGMNHGMDPGSRANKKARWPVGDKPPKATWPAQRNRTTDDV